MFPRKESLKMLLTTEQNSSWNGSLQLNVFPPPKKVPHLHWPTTTTFRNHKHTDWSTRTIITSYCIDLPVNWKSPPPPPQMCFGCSPSFDRVPVHYVSLPFSFSFFFLSDTLSLLSSFSTTWDCSKWIVVVVVVVVVVVPWYYYKWIEKAVWATVPRVVLCECECGNGAIVCVCVCVLSLGGLFCLC